MSKKFGIDATSRDSSYDAGLDSSASELIDHLFAQLDQQLQSDRASTAEGAAMPSADFHSTQALGSTLTECTDLEVSYTPIDNSIEPRDPWQSSFDEDISIGNPQDSKFSQRLFFCLAFTSMGALLLWVVSQVHSRPAVPVVAAVSTARPSIQASSSDIQFASKVTKTLQQVNEKEKSTPPQVAVPKSPPALQPAPIKPGLSTLSAAQASVPKLPVRATVIPARIPVKKEPLPKLLSVKPVGQVTPSSAAALPKVLPNVKPASAPQIAPQTIAAKPTPLTTVSKASQTLVGVMELGDQSVALVANNGATRQVKIGEVLNESGWILVAVENGQAVIRRGGEVRALDPKQKF
jgi:Tfp pilus assembly protein PilP